MYRLRPATADDVEAIATIWHNGWSDGHRGHVPDALYAHRRLADFHHLVPARIGGTTVAIVDSRAAGFVTVRGDEVEQLYVAPAARGTGVAAALLRHGEETIAARSDRAWLAVVAGNARARRFYAREGWRDAGAINYRAQVPSGTVGVPVQRYEKRVAPAAGKGR